ncbi:glucose-repressible alcohol dehydrogenase transcriptional effector-like [Strongylocentrotus purpuratus]|uniref:Endonuclease/exonuclease/phosphatase domain-containing protein n=1 Tax=Strongylocentrotus purpuratus TaxID=7668 RepID=A0A7M7T0X0_STRPU|nr:glucose-repressible alcohol dehydrogenase transcriptional effector-like [Strongylocentrotus purpuratus]
MSSSNQELPSCQREWKASSASSIAGTGDDAVTVISYNILAAIHIKPRGYPFCPTGFRETLERHPQLMVELRHHDDADIVCLQEVETDYYHQTLLPELQKLGYHGVHHQKALGIREGVATFYRSERFRIEKQETGHFKDWIAEKLVGEQIDADLREAIKSRAEYETPILLTSFTCLKTGRPLTVANVHLVWQTHIVPDLNTLQAALALQRLDEFSTQDGPCIMCGDFNHQPVMPGYQLIRDGCLDNESRMHLRKFPLFSGADAKHGKESCLVDILPKWFCHSFKHFKSSYAEIQGEEPPFTCFTDNYGPQWIDAYTKHNRLDGFLEESEESSDPPTPRHFPLKVMDSSLNGSIAPPCHIQTLDYIWYTAEKLHCLGVEEVVKKEAIAPFWACPNQVFPSDHLLMKAKFAFRGL